ncbi:hypothetical protein BSFA1_68140 (plasmid) [Burkholderia sp. SFA1]|nr:hypothetical protein BSFA1_68140 [Burkholderia sp. SFA1]
MQTLSPLTMVMPAVAKRRTHMWFHRMFGRREMALRARDADIVAERMNHGGLHSGEPGLHLK